MKKEGLSTQLIPTRSNPQSKVETKLRCVNRDFTTLLGSEGAKETDWHTCSDVCRYFEYWKYIGEQLYTVFRN